VFAKLLPAAYQLGGFSENAAKNAHSQDGFLRPIQTGWPG
jgi:hypothetical protein